MRSYYTIVGIVLTAVIFFAVGRSTSSAPEQPEKLLAPFPAPSKQEAAQPEIESETAAEEATKPDPEPAPRERPAPEGIRFSETILDGNGTGDFEIEEVVYRDHPMGDSHFEREIRITYRNDASLTRVFTVEGGNRKHQIFLPPTSELAEKVARGRMSLGTIGGEDPPFVASGCGYNAKPLPPLKEE